jgi:hypothetical protein
MVEDVQHNDATTVFNLSLLNSLPVTVADLCKENLHDRVTSKVSESLLYGLTQPVENNFSAFYNCQEELIIQDNYIMWGNHVDVLCKFQDKV